MGGNRKSFWVDSGMGMLMVKACSRGLGEGGS